MAVWGRLGLLGAAWGALFRPLPQARFVRSPLNRDFGVRISTRSSSFPDVCLKIFARNAPASRAITALALSLQRNTGA